MASFNMISGREILPVMSTDLDSLSTNTFILSALQLQSFCWPASMCFDRLSLVLVLLQCNKVFAVNTTVHYESDVLI